jgi:hypothetical protein
MIWVYLTSGLFFATWAAIDLSCPRYKGTYHHSHSTSA